MGREIAPVLRQPIARIIASVTSRNSCGRPDWSATVMPKRSTASSIIMKMPRMLNGARSLKSMLTADC